MDSVAETTRKANEEKKSGNEFLRIALELIHKQSHDPLDE